ncbi:LuxR C-terminal-related transcriptional regulator [Streptomyces sp. NPDC005017]|uniref:LuxR C-terminal-related transcriptional regulator n=1 Tax=Streptomyces sp. NPDC005017 TaxID=3364706 RepID=UPI00369B9343
MSLVGLGLTDKQERLYRYLLRNPGADPYTAAAELGVPDVRRTAAELGALGLLEGELTAVAPALAVDALVRRRLEHAQRQFTELNAVWDVLTELAEEQRSGRRVQMVEHLADGREVTRRIRALLAAEPGEFARVKVLAHDAEPGHRSEPFARLLARGLRSRTVFSAHALIYPEQLDHARRMHALGDLHRVATERLRRLAVVNHAVAFVQADPTGSPGTGAVQIRQPGLVALLDDVFEGLWNRARDLDDQPLTPIEQQVLHSLTTHRTDEAAARSLNISVRKFRAHVADLMTRLGANTRFQAAVRATERGWL